MATLVCAGPRVEEALALRWRDVDLAGGRLTIGRSKTDAGVRTVDMWPELRDELASWKARARRTGSDDLVFGTSAGKREGRSNVSRRLARAVERANADLERRGLGTIPESLTPHSLRRTFASLLYLRGEDPVYVMDQLGHSDPKLALRIYTKVVSRHRRGTGARLVAVLEGPRWAAAARPAHASGAPSPASVSGTA